MENLTVKELRVLAKGFGLPTSGLKFELTDRINQHLLHFIQTQPSIKNEMPTSAATVTQTDGNRVTLISRFKYRIIDPLYRFTTAISSSNPLTLATTNESTPRISLRDLPFQLAIAIGFLGGIHSIIQLLLYYFGDPLTMTIPRNF